jgi:DNA-binding MarR family transcriptional regulator
MNVSPEALEAAQLIGRLGRLARAGEQAERLNPAQWDALRYLARANRFSRTPAALAFYLASTRGTVSRTLAALESKCYVSRGASRRDGRSIEFVLTAKARQALARDPLRGMAANIERAIGGGVAKLLDGLRRTLRTAIARNDGRAFGACLSCAHFRAGIRTSSRAPHHCALLDEPLSEADSAFICVEQEPATAA